MSGRRRRRTERPEARRYQVTERDARLLRAIGRMKLARTSQLRALFFGARETCTQRLAKLLALGLLRTHAPALAGQNIYGLTEKGRDLVLSRTDARPDELHLGPSADRPDLDHLLAVNDVRVALAVAVREGRAR